MSNETIILVDIETVNYFEIDRRFLFLVKFVEMVDHNTKQDFDDLLNFRNFILKLIVSKIRLCMMKTWCYACVE